MTTILPMPASGPESFGDVSHSAESIIQAKEAGILSLEGVALQNGLIPVHLSRETCSPEAEQTVRLLGRVPRVSDPWLPVCLLGPLVVMAAPFAPSR